MHKPVEILHALAASALAALMSVCWTPAAAAELSSFGQTELTQLLHRSQASTVRFVEHQYRKILTAPIERSGELRFEPPASFEKRVLKPASETYRLKNNTLSIELPGRKTRQISTRNQPLLSGLMLGFQAVVSGQLASLEPYYLLNVSGTAQAWQLLLQPRDKEISRYVSSLVVTGRNSEPLKFEVNERSGDRTVTEILP
jgi:hypothetical protein